MIDGVESLALLLAVCISTTLVYLLLGRKLVRKTCGRACAVSGLDLCALPWEHLGESQLLHASSACCAGVVAVLVRDACGFAHLGLLPVCMCCGIAVGAMLEADVAYRILPFELSILLGVSGIAFRALAFGLLAAVQGIAIGLCLAVATLGCWVVGRHKGNDIVGGGDIGAIFAVTATCGDGALLGGLVAFACVLIWKALLLAVKKTPWEEPFPMAPTFVVWIISGLVIAG